MTYDRAQRLHEWDHVGKCLHLTILHIWMCQHVHTQQYVTVLQNCIDMNMCIHPDMWPHSEFPWMWLCSETPCTYQHLTVFRNFICVYVNKWQHSNSIHVNAHMPAKVWLLLETAWMWTYMYTKIYDFMWKWLVCEDVHTCWHLIVLKDCRNANVCMHCLVTMLRSCMHIITYMKLTMW